MKEQEYRHVMCPKCKVMTRLTVKPGNYGHNVKVTCPKCSNVFTTIISAPGENATSLPSEEKMQILNLLIDRMGQAFSRAVHEDSAIREVIAEFEAAGFDFDALTVFSVSARDGSVAFRKPLITNDGKLDLSPEDEQMFRDLKISPE